MLLHRTLSLWVHVIVQTSQCATPRVSRDVSGGLWVIMLCWCKSIDYNNAPFGWGGMLIMGGSCACVGAEGEWGISLPSAEFCWEPKQAGKIFLNSSILPLNI